jgi:hypothetical protein
VSPSGGSRGRLPRSVPSVHPPVTRDPELGTCSVYVGNGSWLRRRIGMYLLFLAATAAMTGLGASGYRSSVPHNNLILALWPLGVVVAGVFVVGVLLAVSDALKPRWRELWIGQQGFAVARGRDRTSIRWSSVGAIARVRSMWWLGGAVKVTFRDAGGRLTSQSLTIRTDLMSLPSSSIVECMAAARGGPRDRPDDASQEDDGTRGPWP